MKLCLSIVAWIKFKQQFIKICEVDVLKMQNYIYSIVINQTAIDRQKIMHDTDRYSLLFMYLLCTRYYALRIHDYSSEFGDFKFDKLENGEFTPILSVPCKKSSETKYPILNGCTNCGLHHTLNWRWQYLPNSFPFVGRISWPSFENSSC